MPADVFNVYSNKEGYDYAVKLTGYQKESQTQIQSQQFPEADKVHKNEVKNDVKNEIKTDVTSRYKEFEELCKRIQDDGEIKSEKQPVSEANSLAEAMAENPAMGGCAHDRSHERILYNRPTSEKIEASIRFRTEGNKFFKQQEFAKAAIHYQRAILYLEYTFPDLPEEEKAYQAAKTSAHLNMASTRFNLQEYHETISQCRQVLRCDPTNLAAIMKVGQAYLAMLEFEKAREAFNEALAVKPGDPKVLDILKVVNERENKANFQSEVLIKRLGNKILPTS